jgi:hypothetical protein
LGQEIIIPNYVTTHRVNALELEFGIEFDDEAVSEET